MPGSGRRVPPIEFHATLPLSPHFPSTTKDTKRRKAGRHLFTGACRLWFVNQSLLGRVFAVHQGKSQFCLGGQLAVHEGTAHAVAHRAHAADDLTLELQHVSGGDLVLEAGILDAAEQGQFALVLRLAEIGRASCRERV